MAAVAASVGTLVVDSEEGVLAGYVVEAGGFGEDE